MPRDHTGKLRLMCSYCGEFYYEEDGHDYALCCRELRQQLAGAREAVRYYRSLVAKAEQRLKTHPKNEGE